MITGGVASEPRDRPRTIGLILLGAILLVAIVDGEVRLREQLFIGSFVAIQAYGLQFAWRYCCVFSLAITALSGIGGYTSIILAERYSAPFWLGAIASIPIALAIGLLVGTLGVRTSGMHFVMLTFALTGLFEVVG